MVLLDLYAGYEGEMKAFIREKDVPNQIVFEVRMMYSVVYTIFRKLPFDATSLVESVVYNWNVGNGWGEVESEYKRIQEFYNQLQAVTTLIAVEDQAEYNALFQYVNLQYRMETNCTFCMNKMFMATDISI